MAVSPAFAAFGSIPPPESPAGRCPGRIGRPRPEKLDKGPVTTYDDEPVNSTVKFLLSDIYSNSFAKKLRRKLVMPTARGKLFLLALFLRCGSPAACGR